MTEGESSDAPPGCEPTDDEAPPSSEPSRWARVARVALPLAVLALAGVAAALLAASAEEPQSAEGDAEGLVVATERVVAERATYLVRGQGDVSAARTTDLRPQVSGRVTWVAEGLEPGAIVREGDALFRIDRTDYRLGLEQSRAQLAEAKLRLESEAAREDVARTEWEMYQEEFGAAEAPALALREPQRRAAEVGLRAARARTAQNRVALSRTTVRAPYDAFVDDESVEVGALVDPQLRVARLVGVDHFWVRAAIPLAEVQRLHLGDGGSPRATLEVRGEELAIEREGTVVRLLGRLDERSRMARVLIRVDDPFRLERPPEDRGLPLLVGSYVDVSIETEEPRPVVRVPAAAVHDGRRVFVFDAGALDIRAVSGLRWRGEDVLVAGGLDDGERVVISPLSQPVDGMPLRREAQ